MRPGWRGRARSGFSLEPTRFTPRASPAAPDPKHRDQLCAGLRVRVRDARRAEPYRLGITLLHALRAQSGFRWRGEGALDTLLGTPRVREALERGASVAEILAADQDAIARFRRERAAVLLY